APDIAGKNIANPYAMIMSGQMMLESLGHRLGHEPAIHAARAIADACEHVIQNRTALTPDLGGKASTREMGDAIVARIHASGVREGAASRSVLRT
ncbi:MAG: isocitrate/isopropylmalate family dehydrogenase, partial [Candidatus Baltobacteraceae bacterium]